MAWTEPRTWVVGEIVTAAQLNTHVRDNFNETTRRQEGTYVGDGSTADRKITLPFTPKFVVVVGDSAGGSPYAFSNIAGSVWGLHFDGTGALGLESLSSGAPRVTDGGFLVSGPNADQLNKSGGTYHYVAFG